MGRWLKPRLIASKGIWYINSFDYDGPACYELGLGGPRGGNLHWKYVGETINERKRMTCYARHGSHLSELIDHALADGWYLYYKAHAFPTKELAKQKQDRFLREYNYPWNKLLNGDRF